MKNTDGSSSVASFRSLGTYSTIITKNSILFLGIFKFMVTPTETQGRRNIFSVSRLLVPHLTSYLTNLSKFSQRWLKRPENISFSQRTLSVLNQWNLSRSPNKTLETNLRNQEKKGFLRKV